MSVLLNYREVGRFDVLESPHNQMGGLDSEQFKNEAIALVEKGTRYLVLDLGNIDFLYSDAFNAFSIVHQQLVIHEGTFGVLTLDALAKQSLLNSHVDRIVKIYTSEAELMAASLQAEPKTAPQPLVVDLSPAKPAARSAHRVAQSFNSQRGHASDADDYTGIPPEFVKEKKAGLPIAVIVVAVLLLMALATAFWWFKH